MFSLTAAGRKDTSPSHTWICDTSPLHIWTCGTSSSHTWTCDTSPSYNWTCDTSPSHTWTCDTSPSHNWTCDTSPSHTLGPVIPLLHTLGPAIPLLHTIGPAIPLLHTHLGLRYLSFTLLGCISLSLAIFKQPLRIISGEVVHQFSADGDSHRKTALRLLKRRDGTRHVDDVGVSPGVPPVNPNPRTVYNHSDAVIMCSDRDPDPPNILESDRVKFFTLNYIIIDIPHQQTGRCLTLSLAGTKAVVWGKVH